MKKTIPFTFQIKGWPQFDGRKKYTIKKILRDKSYHGGYKIYTNENKCPISIGVLIKKF